MPMPCSGLSGQPARMKARNQSTIFQGIKSNRRIRLLLVPQIVVSGVRDVRLNDWHCYAAATISVDSALRQERECQSEERLDFVGMYYWPSPSIVVKKVMDKLGRPIVNSEGKKPRKQIHLKSGPSSYSRELLYISHAQESIRKSPPCLILSRLLILDELTCTRLGEPVPCVL